MNDYKSLRKKNGSRMLALVMVVLIVLEMCSLAVLFSQIATYSVGPSSKYVISLTEGAERTKAGTVDTSKTGFIVPTSVVDPDTLIEPSDSVNTLDFGFSTRDVDQVWTTGTEIELFHLTYDNETGETTVISENGDKVFAPGTANTYVFTVANTGTHNLDYLVYIEATEDTDGHSLPLVGRLRRGDGTYLVGGDTDSSEWPDVLELNESGDLSSLSSGSTMDYFIDWEWPFERTGGEGLDANDAYDTFLGNLAVDTDLKLIITIKTVAWWEDYWLATADVKSGEGTASVTPDKVLQESDGTFTFTAVPDEGYEFVGWEFDEGDIYEIISGSLTDPTLVVKPGSDVHGHAIFKPIPTTPGVEYWYATADVKSGEGTATVTPASVEQGSDDTFKFTATPAEGYEFVGWEFDEDDVYEIIGGSLTDPTITVKPGSDIHGHAVFKPAPTEPVPEYWNATADVKSGEGTADVTPAKVEKGSDDTFKFTATPAEGYEFVGWEFDEDDVYEIISGSLTDPTITVKPGSDIHGHAVFKPIPTEPVPEYWNATADVKSGEGTATVSPETVEKGSDDTFKFTATPAEGYEFVGWEFDEGDVYEIIGGSLTDPTITVKPGSDIHGHAVFKPIPVEAYYTAEIVEIIGDGTATVDPGKVKVDSEDYFHINAEPGDGYVFDHWAFDDGDIYVIIDGSLTDPNLVVKPGSDLHIHAVFKTKPTEPPTTPATDAPTEPPTEAPTTPIQPQTGDSTHTVLWLVISLTVFCGLVVVFFLYRRSRKAEKVGQRIDD